MITASKEYLESLKKEKKRIVQKKTLRLGRRFSPSKLVKMVEIITC